MLFITSLSFYVAFIPIIAKKKNRKEKRNLNRVELQPDHNTTQHMHVVFEPF